MTLRPNDYDRSGDIIPDSVREDKGDFISREALKKAIEEYKYCGFYDKLIEIIDNATPVRAFTEEDMAGAYNEGYACGGRESKRSQGECCGSCYLCDVGDCKADPQKGGVENG